MNHRNSSRCGDVSIRRPVMEGPDTRQYRKSRKDEWEPEFGEGCAKQRYVESTIFSREGQLHNIEAKFSRTRTQQSGGFGSFKHSRTITLKIQSGDINHCNRADQRHNRPYQNVE